MSKHRLAQSWRCLCPAPLWFVLFAVAVPSGWSFADANPAPKPAANAPSDTLVFENGDTLTGRLEREVSGTVYFNSTELGEVSVPWTKLRSLHTAAGFVVLENKPGVHLRHYAADAARGALTLRNDTITLDPGNVPPPLKEGTVARQQPAAAAPPQPIPVKNVQFILDEATFNRQVQAEPNFFEGWNGSATAGVTLVQGTQNQYTYSSAIALVRTVPTVSWLTTRNRTTADFASSYGKITQPAYTSAGTFVPATYTKSSIFHADAERDQYVSERFYALTQTAFDHNYSQGLDLQQIYGAGMGYTVVKRPLQQLDLKATLQYERQVFITSASGTNQELVGSTFAVTYLLKSKKGIVFNQQLAYIPAYNNARAYSANESDTLTFPLYKNIAFTVGSIDSYLNDPVPTEPPTTRNSFQFTTGVTYTLKSKY
ncbi:DUF481 domain-containing protein [Acidipila sp. EB88]|uniref:DUF481 domain-containing protein n=1 Tax=Acidipila sp. EB88 TaxID=2305226 RepID=UPI0013153971|nr:DUF481 domain-containing protein [Acidipila sp. EB88]